MGIKQEFTKCSENGEYKMLTCIPVCTNAQPTSDPNNPFFGCIASKHVRVHTREIKSVLSYMMVGLWQSPPPVLVTLYN